MARDWSLVVFTVIGQTAVGLFLVAAGTLYFAAGIPERIAGRDFRLGLVLGVLGLLLAGVVSSFFHLHHPRRAFRAVSNLRSSWLSREIFFLLIFLALLAVLAVGEWTGGAGGPPRRPVFILAGLAGLLFLACMALIYTLPAVPFWDRVATPLSFFLTALMTGTLGASLVFKLAEEAGGFWRPLARVSVVSVALGFAAALLFSPRYGLLDRKEEPSLIPPSAYLGRFHTLRLFLIASGAVLAAVGFLAAAFVAVFSGEIVGRLLFYGLRGGEGKGGLIGP